MFKCVYIFSWKSVGLFFVDKKHFTRNNGMCRARKWMKWKYGEKREKKIRKFCVSAAPAVRHNICTCMHACYFLYILLFCWKCMHCIPREHKRITLLHMHKMVLLCETPNMETKHRENIQGENSIESHSANVMPQKKEKKRENTCDFYCALHADDIVLWSQVERVRNLGDVRLLEWMFKVLLVVVRHAAAVVAELVAPH